MSAIGAAAITAGAAIAGGITQSELQYAKGKKAQKRQFNYQKELNQQAADINYQQWLRTSYPAQVEQMKAAGLNPGLQYGMSGGGGQASGIGSGGAAPSNPAPQYNLGIDAPQLMALQAQIENTKADTQLKLAEANKTEGVDTQEAKARINDLTQGVENKQAQQALTKVQTAWQEFEMKEAQMSQEDRLNQIEWLAKKSMHELNIASNEAYMSNATKDDKIDIIRQQVIGAQLSNEALSAGINLTKAQITKISETITQEWARIQQENERIGQGDRGLDQKDKEIIINKARANAEIVNPNILNSIGGIVESGLITLDKATRGNYRSNRYSKEIK